MKHHWATKPFAPSLFDGSNSFNDFRKKLIKLSKSLPDEDPCRWRRAIDPKDNENKILGDGFELFVECFVNCFGTHRHVGLSNYEPIDPDKDHGIDAFANNILEEPSAVQVKFCADATFELSPTNSNLPSFINEAAFTLENVDWTIVPDVKRLFLITSGSGIDWVGQSKWGGRIHVIDIHGIKQLVDNNLLFWSKCVELTIGD